MPVKLRVSMNRGNWLVRIKGCSADTLNLSVFITNWMCLLGRLSEIILLRGMRRIGSNLRGDIGSDFRRGTKAMTRMLTPFLRRIHNPLIVSGVLGDKKIDWK